MSVASAPLILQEEKKLKQDYSTIKGGCFLLFRLDSQSGEQDEIIVFAAVRGEKKPDTARWTTNSSARPVSALFPYKVS